MKTFTETVRIDLENLRKILKSRQKYPTNITYKENQRRTQLELDKDFNRLGKFVKQLKNKEATSKIETLRDYIEYLIHSEVDSKKGQVDINESERILNHLEIIDESVSNPTDTSPLPNTILEKLGKIFEMEIRDLALVYSGRSGTCTAFMLRKILEKAIYLAFARNGLINKLRDPKNPKRFVGLERMIEIAANTQARDGSPFLLQKNVDELMKIKFLGDDAAHDFLYNVDIEIIEKEKSYISIVLGQIARKL